MSAVFGRLQDETLDLGNGLNILQAPTETGKSTWCAFLLSMLYGINSRERERAGYIPDKIRYAPWSGAAMSGRLECRVEGRELTITRSTRRQAAPFGEFQAVYTGTGDAVSELTAQFCGEALLGVSREVFERSAFIRQAGLPISQDAGLERRIASLITSGEEETSYSEAAELLKKQLNRRRHNKTGQLPALEAKLQETERQTAEVLQMAEEFTRAQAQTEALSAQVSALESELGEHDRWEAARQQQALHEAASEALAAQQRAEALRQGIAQAHIPENDTIGRLRGAIVNLDTTRKAVEKARAERDEALKALLRAEAAVNESPFAGESAESARRSGQPASPSRIPGAIALRELAIFCLFTAIAAGAAYLLFSQGSSLSAPLSQILPWLVFAGVTAVGGVLSRLYRSRALSSLRDTALHKRFGTTNPNEISALADAYIQALNTRDTAQGEADRRSAAADTLYNSLTANEQALLLEVRRFAPSAFDLSAADQLLRTCAVRRRELQEAESEAASAKLRYDLLSQQTPELPDGELSQPARSRRAAEDELTQVRALLASARSAADQLSGRLGAAGDPVVLESSAALLRREIQELESEYGALKLAQETLERANTALQGRFSPALGKRASEIFSKLTGGRYSGVVLDRLFRLSAEPAGDPLYRDAALLSAGTADQLYLATRLAICDLVLPADRAVPIVLDDALANFDDERCAAALRWLRQEAERRQILLFTCHSREAEFFAGDAGVRIQRLTGPV